MNFEWDECKNEINIDKHGFDFADAHRIFNLPMLVDIDDRSDYGEDRWIGTGILDNRIVIVIFTEIDRETTRIVSVRKALSRERRDYEQYIKNKLGED